MYVSSSKIYTASQTWLGILTSYITILPLQRYFFFFLFFLLWSRYFYRWFFIFLEIEAVFLLFHFTPPGYLHMPSLCEGCILTQLLSSELNGLEKVVYFDGFDRRNWWLASYTIKVLGIALTYHLNFYHPISPFSLVYPSASSYLTRHRFKYHQTTCSGRMRHKCSCKNHHQKCYKWIVGRQTSLNKTTGLELSKYSYRRSAIILCQKDL